MGYGAALLYTADDLSSYRSTLDSVTSLSNSERDALAFAHLEASLVQKMRVARDPKRRAWAHDGIQSSLRIPGGGTGIENGFVLS